MAYFIGTAGAIGVALFAWWMGLDRERGFYPTVMTVIALIYVLFASIDGRACVLVAEVAVGIAFVVLAMAGYKRSLWLVAAALAAHGVFDLFHPHVIDNRGVPGWWPAFCMSYDVVAAVILGGLIWRRARPLNPGVSGRSGGA